MMNLDLPNEEFEDRFRAIQTEQCSVGEDCGVDSIRVFSDDRRFLNFKS